MTVVRLWVALMISLAPLTLGSDQLPSSVETVLLGHLNAGKIIDVHDVRQRTVGEFDYLGLFATFEANSGFEKWSHQQVILRKKHLDANWSQAQFFHSGRRLADLFALTEPEFQKALTPW